MVMGKELGFAMHFSCKVVLYQKMGSQLKALYAYY